LQLRLPEHNIRSLYFANLGGNLFFCYGGRGLKDFYQAVVYHQKAFELSIRDSPQSSSSSCISNNLGILFAKPFDLFVDEVKDIDQAPLFSSLEPLVSLLMILQRSDHYKDLPENDRSTCYEDEC
jgi:hypothetical protein